MMAIAVRHGAIDTNPIDGVERFTRRTKQSRGKVKDQQALPAFHAQLRAWARGEEIPGTPAYRCGPARDWALVWVIDVITGTGMRPHEVFALLLDDVVADERTAWAAGRCRGDRAGGVERRRLRQRVHLLVQPDRLHSGLPRVPADRPGCRRRRSADSAATGSSGVEGEVPASADLSA
jgi:integrase